MYYYRSFYLKILEAHLLQFKSNNAAKFAQNVFVR